ncbi:flotillin-1 [Plakobranchus ocellatus]|uniref:Flotillin-1 n=1 Tax=Plakobranchus ocellatus TaxID=259542 RepID=A0AAV3XTE3_9GAST|nr:flotillin-1 [Plakobranchus ocellatus]
MGFETCGPNEVMVVSGECGENGGEGTNGKVEYERLSLNVMTLIIESPHIYTKLGVPVSVTGVAQVKIQGGNEKILQAACELFLGKSEVDIMKVARETLEGHQRAILGQMTVEEIYQDRKQFSRHVFEVASSDLVNMGIYVVSYTIKDIHDEVEARAEEKRLQARYYNDTCIAEADRDYNLKKAAYDKEVMTCKAMADLAYSLQHNRWPHDYDDWAVIGSYSGEGKLRLRGGGRRGKNRNYNLKKATYDKEVMTCKVMADLAYSLQAANTKQKVAEETMQIKVVEREMQISVEEYEITRRAKELQARVNVPADAEKFRLETLAQAEANRTIVAAQAEADAVKMKGEAEAAAIEACGQAEAEAMAKKADAWKDFQEAAKVDMILEKLPQVAAEIANPLTSVKSVKMVSSGQGDVGVFKLTNEVMSIMEKLPFIVENMTGLSVSRMKGEAEAAAIEACGQAEAEAMAKKADAWKDFQEAAKVDMILEKLPQVAAEIANPLTSVKSVKMVSSGQGDVGVFKLTNEVMSIMEKLPFIVENMTGLSVSRVVDWFGVWLPGAGGRVQTRDKRVTTDLRAISLPNVSPSSSHGPGNTLKYHCSVLY